jgi:hypothetical protein
MSRNLTYTIITIVLSACFSFLAAGDSLSLELEGGPGWLFPYGDWSSGFSRGNGVQVQVRVPFTSALSVGAGLTALSLDGKENPGALNFLLPGAALRYEIDALAGIVVPHVSFCTGISHEVLEVGSGRETDYDVFVTMGGGMSWSLNARASLLIEASHLWFVAPGGGRGFTVTPSFRFEI